MKLKLQNVGGIINESIELKEGLNVIRAPNAVGKTSFTHGINIISMDNLQLREHPEFVNDFASKASVEIEENGIKTKRVVEISGLKPMSKTLPIYRMNGKDGIIFANPENEFLDTVIKGKPIDKFLNGFSNAKYYEELIKKEGVLKDLMSSIDVEYGEHKTHKKDAIEIKEKLEKYNKELKKLRDEKIKTQIELDKSKKELLKDKETKDTLAVLTKERNNFNETIGIGKGKIKAFNDEAKEIEDRIFLFKGILETFNREHPDLDGEIQKLAEKAEKIRKELEGDEELEEKGLYDKIKGIDLQIEYCETNIDIEKSKCLSCGQKFTQAQRDIRLKKLNKEKDISDDRMKDLESELETTEKEKTSLKENVQEEYAIKEKDLEDADTSKDKNQANIRDWNSKLEDSKKDLEKNKVEMKELQKNLSPKLNKIIAREEILTEKITEKIKDIEENKTNYEILSPSIKKVEILSTRYNFLKKVIEIVKIKLIELKNAVRERFNKKIMSVYNKLGFKDFKNIEIDSTFRIKVNRKGKEQELNRLSTSERVTLGVLVMLVGKEEYLPDYPFFVLDEVTTAYDPTRFKKIIDYITKETNTKYTIVTAFSPTGDKIKVEYKL